MYLGIAVSVASQIAEASITTQGINSIKISSSHLQKNSHSQKMHHSAACCLTSTKYNYHLFPISMTKDGRLPEIAYEAYSTVHLIKVNQTFFRNIQQASCSTE